MAKYGRLRDNRERLARKNEILEVKHNIINNRRDC